MQRAYMRCPQLDLYVKPSGSSCDLHLPPKHYYLQLAHSFIPWFSSRAWAKMKHSSTSCKCIIEYIYAIPHLVQRTLITSSPLISIALHCWLYASNSQKRQQADLDRLHLVFHDTLGCHLQIEKYVDAADSQIISKRLGIIVKTHDVSDSTLVECIAFLNYIQGKDPSQTRLDLWKEALGVLRRIVDSPTIQYDVRIASIVQANILLEYVPCLYEHYN